MQYGTKCQHIANPALVINPPILFVRTKKGQLVREAMSEELAAWGVRLGDG